jgi:hypothetical protein
MEDLTPEVAIAVWRDELLGHYEGAAQARRELAEHQAGILKVTGQINTATRILELQRASAKPAAGEGGEEDLAGDA